MTSPPRRPIISLKFKKPDIAAGDLTPPVPPTPPKPPAPPPARKFEPATKTVFTVNTEATAKAKGEAKAKAEASAKAEAAPKPQQSRKSGPAISPDLFKAAIKAAGLAINNIVADPEWKSEDLLHQYQAAKEHATSTQKQQAKLVSTVATRRHGKDIEQADVESPAMRAAYAAALVALVRGVDKSEEA